VKINVKTRIRYNGQEYSDPNQLPPDVRAAYDKAMAEELPRKKIVANGREFADENEIPEDVRRLYGDVMSVIENNGEVTLPCGSLSAPVFTKRQRQLVMLVVGGLILVGLLVVTKAIN